MCVHGDMPWPCKPKLMHIIHTMAQVVATDGGVPGLTAETTVTVVVLDINDSPPQFNSTFLSLTIPENELVGSIIGEFVAMDSDQGSAANLVFTLIGDYAERYDCCMYSLLE